MIRFEHFAQTQWAHGSSRAAREYWRKSALIKLFPQGASGSGSLCALKKEHRNSARPRSLTKGTFTDTLCAQVISAAKDCAQRLAWSRCAGLHLMGWVGGGDYFLLTIKTLVEKRLHYPKRKQKNNKRDREIRRKETEREYFGSKRKEEWRRLTFKNRLRIAEKDNRRVEKKMIKIKHKIIWLVWHIC